LCLSGVSLNPGWTLFERRTFCPPLRTHIQLCRYMRWQYNIQTDRKRKRIFICICLWSEIGNIAYCLRIALPLRQKRCS
jgi:hypothetical protein